MGGFWGRSSWGWILQAQTQGGSWEVWLGGSRPRPRGRLGSGWGGPGPGGGGPGPGLWGSVSQHALRQAPPADSYCCGRYAFYWNAFLYFFFLSAQALHVFLFHIYFRFLYMSVELLIQRKSMTHIISVKKADLSK